MDEGPGHEDDSAIVDGEAYAGEVAVRVANECVQIHGGYGFIKDYPAENSIATLNSARSAKAQAKSSGWSSRERTAQVHRLDEQLCCEDFFKGDTRALARIITRVENRSPDSLALLQQLFPHTGQSQRHRRHRKSRRRARARWSIGSRPPIGEQDKTLAIVAVDPSSPFTGGAILGDRIRMQTPGIDPGVYIRSMATRGHLGGLAAATADVVTRARRRGQGSRSLLKP